jgi:hypothetical protein
MPPILSPWLLTTLPLAASRLWSCSVEIVMMVSLQDVERLVWLSAWTLYNVNLGWVYIVNINLAREPRLSTTPSRRDPPRRQACSGVSGEASP